MTMMGGIFVWLLGLCIGSFLNVVIHRLPRGMSIGRPRRSFCPKCERPIAARDNIPVLSWLMLGGRCRSCGAGISVQYPLVEAATGTAFVLVYHLIVVAGARQEAPFSWPSDAPLLALWLLLASTMVACTAMDFTAYMIDVRVTDFCLATALAIGALGSNTPEMVRSASGPASAGAAAAAIACGVMMYVTVWRKPGATEEVVEEGARETGGWRPSAKEAEDERESAGTEGMSGTRLDDTTGAGDRPTHAIAAMIGMIAMVLLAGAIIVGPAIPGAVAIWGQMPAIALGVFFVAMVLTGSVKRESDAEIHEAIEREGPQARRTALRELLWLTPIVVAGVTVYAAVAYVAPIRETWETVSSVQIGAFRPMTGISQSALGIVVGGGAGWALRVVFTLVLGREAFGTGDIYILTAAGAAIGWQLVLLGLLCAVGLALAGWAIGLLLKSGFMIPFGPWLALGFVVALWIWRPFAVRAEAYFESISAVARSQPGTALLFGGLLLAGSVAAVVIARLLRVWLESRLGADDPK